MAKQLSTNSLRQTRRLITTHDADGLAIFSEAFPEIPPAQRIPTGDELSLAYATAQFPIDPNTDLATYQRYLTHSPGFTIRGGTVLCQIDMAPGSSAPFHRTQSLDYCIVVEGAVELVLDGSQARKLQRGDLAIQRGTRHSWRNASETEWARVFFVLQDAKPVTVGGKTLEEDFAGMGDSQ
jgi:quercetin dioxygenase-like cupin family protein